MIINKQSKINLNKHTPAIKTKTARVSCVLSQDEVMAVTHIVSSDTAEMRGSQEEEWGKGLRAS